MQHDLIACLGKVNSGALPSSGSAGFPSSHEALIDSVRAHMMEGRGAVKSDIKLIELLGRGSVSLLLFLQSL
jgi:hypothetical protein